MIENTLIQASWLKLKTTSPELGELFYQELFAVNPELQSLFTGSTETKSKKRLKALDSTISSLEKLRSKPLKTMSLPDLAEFSDYDGIVPTSFLQMVEKQLGKNFTLPIKKSWLAASQNITKTIVDSPLAIALQIKIQSNGILRS